MIARVLTLVHTCIIRVNPCRNDWKITKNTFLGHVTTQIALIGGSIKRIYGLSYIHKKKNYSPTCRVIICLTKLGRNDFAFPLSRQSVNSHLQRTPWLLTSTKYYSLLYMYMGNMQSSKYMKYMEQYSSTWHTILFR